MDSIPRHRFYKIFEKLPNSFNIKGKYTIHEIEDELYKARDNCLRKAKKAKTVQERAKFKREALQYDNLIRHNFAPRVLYEAGFNPRGLIGMSLRYGIADAKQRILTRENGRTK